MRFKFMKADALGLRSVMTDDHTFVCEVDSDRVGKALVAALNAMVDSCSKDRPDSSATVAVRKAYNTLERIFYS